MIHIWTLPSMKTLESLRVYFENFGLSLNDLVLGLYFGLHLGNGLLLAS